ncbi:hypothetical protein GCM10023093_03430 [Nemorincola caseinilytica]|uniref:N-acetyltransferase domain-containing protein n=1 Tax=Nemorincola caseinilytica TaxID=2054315 RepID=A0ABP8N392_9BACT
MSNIEIIPVDVKEHYVAISAMMRGLHDNERILNHRTALWDDIETSYMRHIVQMQAECEGLCLVAYNDDVPVGFIFGYVEEEDDSRFEEYTGRVLYVSDGFVDAAHRRRGIYSKLNKQLEIYFMAAGVKRIYRFALVGNDNMRHFLTGDGYTPTRILYEKWL